MSVGTQSVKQAVNGIRRRTVKKYGKKIFRQVDRYLARQSRIPNTPVLNPDLFPWVAELELNWTVVLDELAAVLRCRDALPRFQDISPDQMRISPDDKWHVFVLYGFGY